MQKKKISTEDIDITQQGIDHQLTISKEAADLFNQANACFRDFLWKEAEEKYQNVLANATITGLNGDVLQFINADLAALTGFVNTNDAAYVTPTSTSGSTIKSAGLVAGAGTQTATGTTAQFLYNSTTGSLKFDVDGGGSGAAIDVATIIATGLTLTATDFLIVA